MDDENERREGKEQKLNGTVGRSTNDDKINPSVFTQDDYTETLLGKDNNEKEETNKKVKFIQLKDGISWLNASNIFFTYFVGISQIVFFDLTLVYLLKSESYFNIKESDIPKLSADIVFYSQPFTLVFDIIIGYMHDKLGRRVTCFISTIVCVLAFVLLPFMKSVYPGLLIIRILLNFSLKGPITAPLSADYIVSSTRGKAVAFTGLGAGVGAIFGVFCLFTVIPFAILPYNSTFCIFC